MEKMRKKLADAFNDLFANVKKWEHPGILECVETVVTEKRLYLELPVGCPHPDGLQVLKNIDRFVVHFPIIGEDDWVIVRYKRYQSNSTQCYLAFVIALAPPMDPI
jgi:hypothetical protein